jgi:hypothetical protein
MFPELVSASSEQVIAPPIDFLPRA